MKNNNNNFPAIVVQRPKKWDVPFGRELTDEFIYKLLSTEPFQQILQEKTSNESDLEKQKKRLQPIINIFKNESRVIQLPADHPLYVETNYGNSAFIVLKGRVNLYRGASSKVSAQSTSKKGLLGRLVSHLKMPRMPEVRSIEKQQPSVTTGSASGVSRSLRKYLISLEDVERTVEQGGIAGIVSAMRRSPRTFTAVTAEDCHLLEIKWQGLRDLMGVSKAFKEYCEKFYRQRGLQTELSKIDVLQGIGKASLSVIAEKAVFESFGKRNWLDPGSNVLNESVNQILEIEPTILQEEEYASSLNIISNGFIRVTKKLPNSEVTVGFLKPGDCLGLYELLHNYDDAGHIDLQHSYKAIGCVDVIRIPAVVVHEYIFKVNKEKVTKTLDRYDFLTNNQSQKLSETLLNKNAVLLNKLINHRYINGTKAMVINTEACVGCDDCVRACSANHDNNPRFVRQGVKVEKLLIANACMHCVDPLCLIGCPTGAIHRNKLGGEVIINDDVCIGCTTCANNCPYENIRMVHVFDQQGNVMLDEENKPICKATKCDLCYQQPVSPACEVACPHGALKRLDLQNLQELVSWGS